MLQRRDRNNKSFSSDQIKDMQKPKSRMGFMRRIFKKQIEQFTVFGSLCFSGKRCSKNDCIQSENLETVPVDGVQEQNHRATSELDAKDSDHPEDSVSPHSDDSQSLRVSSSDPIEKFHSIPRSTGLVNSNSPNIMESAVERETVTMKGCEKQSSTVQWPKVSWTHKWNSLKCSMDDDIRLNTNTNALKKTSGDKKEENRRPSSLAVRSLSPSESQRTVSSRNTGVFSNHLNCADSYSPFYDPSPGSAIGKRRLQAESLRRRLRRYPHHTNPNLKQDTGPPGAFRIRGHADIAMCAQERRSSILDQEWQPAAGPRSSKQTKSARDKGTREPESFKPIGEELALAATVADKSRMSRESGRRDERVSLIESTAPKRTDQPSPADIDREQVAESTFFDQSRGVGETDGEKEAKGTASSEGVEVRELIEEVREGEAVDVRPTVNVDADEDGTRDSREAVASPGDQPMAGELQEGETTARTESEQAQEQNVGANVSDVEAGATVDIPQMTITTDDKAEDSETKEPTGGETVQGVDSEHEAGKLSGILPVEPPEGERGELQQDRMSGADPENPEMTSTPTEVGVSEPPITSDVLQEQPDVTIEKDRSPSIKIQHSNLADEKLTDGLQQEEVHEDHGAMNNVPDQPEATNELKEQPDPRLDEETSRSVKVKYSSQTSEKSIAELEQGHPQEDLTGKDELAQQPQAVTEIPEHVDVPSDAERSSLIKSPRTSRVSVKIMPEFDQGKIHESVVENLSLAQQPEATTEVHEQVDVTKVEEKSPSVKSPRSSQAAEKLPSEHEQEQPQADLVDKTDLAEQTEATTDNLGHVDVRMDSGESTGRLGIQPSSNEKVAQPEPKQAHDNRLSVQEPQAGVELEMLADTQLGVASSHSEKSMEKSASERPPQAVGQSEASVPAPQSVATAEAILGTADEHVGSPVGESKTLPSEVNTGRIPGDETLQVATDVLTEAPNTITADQLGKTLSRSSLGKVKPETTHTDSIIGGIMPQQNVLSENQERIDNRLEGHRILSDMIAERVITDRSNQEADSALPIVPQEEGGVHADVGLSEQVYSTESNIPHVPEPRDSTKQRDQITFKPRASSKIPSHAPEMDTLDSRCSMDLRMPSYDRPPTTPVLSSQVPHISSSSIPTESSIKTPSHLTPKTSGAQVVRRNVSSTSESRNSRSLPVNISAQEQMKPSTHEPPRKTSSPPDESVPKMTAPSPVSKSAHAGRGSGVNRLEEQSASRESFRKETMPTEANRSEGKIGSRESLGKRTEPPDPTASARSEEQPPSQPLPMSSRLNVEHSQPQSSTMLRMVINLVQSSPYGPYLPSTSGPQQGQFPAQGGGNWTAPVSANDPSTLIPIPPGASAQGPTFTTVISSWISVDPTGVTVRNDLNTLVCPSSMDPSTLIKQLLETPEDALTAEQKRLINALFNVLGINAKDTEVTIKQKLERLGYKDPRMLTVEENELIRLLDVVIGSKMMMLNTGAPQSTSMGAGQKQPAGRITPDLIQVLMNRVAELRSKPSDALTSQEHMELDHLLELLLTASQLSSANHGRETWMESRIAYIENRIAQLQSIRPDILTEAERAELQYLLALSKSTSAGRQRIGMPRVTRTPSVEQRIAQLKSMDPRDLSEAERAELEYLLSLPSPPPPVQRRLLRIASVEDRINELKSKDPNSLTEAERMELEYMLVLQARDHRAKTPEIEALLRNLLLKPFQNLTDTEKELLMNILQVSSEEALRKLAETSRYLFTWDTDEEEDKEEDKRKKAFRKLMDSTSGDAEDPICHTDYNQYPPFIPHPDQAKHFPQTTYNGPVICFWPWPMSSLHDNPRRSADFIHPVANTCMNNTSSFIMTESDTPVTPHEPQLREEAEMFNRDNALLPEKVFLSDACAMNRQNHQVSENNDNATDYISRGSSVRIKQKLTNMLKHIGLNRPVLNKNNARPERKR